MESNKSWKVICTGNIKTHYTEEMVTDNISQAFKFSAEKAKRLIQCSPTTVKKGIDQQAALTYQQVLEDAGVETQIQEYTEVAKSGLDALSLVPLETTNSAEENPQKQTKPTPPQMLQRPHSHAQPAAHSYTQQAIEDTSEEDTDETIFDKIGENKKPILALIALLLFVKAFFFQDTHFQEIGNSPGALAQIEALNKALAFPDPDEEKLRALLRSQKYFQLESILTELNDSVYYDISWEDTFRASISAISDTDKVSLAMLNHWVDSTESAYAYLSRGAFYVDAGSAARGNKFANQTSEAQFNTMNKLYLAAYSDLMNAKSIDNSLLPTFALLIQINVGDGSYNPREKYLAEAISVNPAGYQYRYSYMNYIKPKWGGSWAEMDDLAASTSPYFALNPRLRLLSGYMPAEKGQLAMNDNDTEDCISYYSEALQFGIHSEWLRHRAYCLYDNGDFEQSLKDITLFLSKFDSATDYDRKLNRYLLSKVK